MKKIISIMLVLISVFAVVGCEQKSKATEASLAFKEDYEKLNGKENKSGKVHRTVSIDEVNPYVEVSADEIVKKIENKETFYVYFGSTLCPWCRSTIESAIKVAKEKNIETIYYVDVWDDEGNEILRDKLEVDKKGKVKVAKEGTESYYKLLDYFDEYLRNYDLTDSKGKAVESNEKRIYAPNYMYIENGNIKKLTNGKADSQKDAREELTEQLKNEQLAKFRDFFNN
ncbi:MAG: thioredoxin family protein [Firmicutes bacterium]|nr:thioredoxin family protein [Bacillota bacterium]